ncbi:MAG: hypothetical protein ACR2RF_12110, partial [Geminicoccaceae bacterium]
AVCRNRLHRMDNRHRLLRQGDLAMSTWPSRPFKDLPACYRGGYKQMTVGTFALLTQRADLMVHVAWRTMAYDVDVMTIKEVERYFNAI